MPELPEVETIVRKLQSVVSGKEVDLVTIINPKTFYGLSEQLHGQTLLRVHRRAKVIEMYFGNDLVLLTHLKMTGQYLFRDHGQLLAGGHPTNDWQEQLPGKHTRVQIDFKDGAQLFFNDMRKFGWLKLIDLAKLPDVYSKFGPDIVDDSLTSEYLFAQLQKRKVPIKQAIMNNEILCGVGNIYACDSLNLAKVSPTRPAKSLNKKEVGRLLESMRQVIFLAIENGGTTFDGKYVDIDGKSGNYQTKVLTYGREGKNCYNCGSKIEKIKQGGRGTYYCPNCQK